jgi:hypothetical protein
MKKVLLFLLLITQFTFAQINTSTVKAGKYQMNIPENGAKKDSVVVWDGVTKIMKILPVSEIKGTTNLNQLATPTGITVFSSTGTDAVLSLATATDAGLQSPASKTKLDGIEAGAQVNVPTNLEGTTSPDGGVIFSSTGTAAFIPLANTSISGLLSPVDKTKLNSIATGATANQTDAYLLNRSNHTGSQDVSTISGLSTLLDLKANLSGAVFSGDVQVPAIPVNANSAIAKTYLDNALTGITWKNAVRAATTANITLSGTQTIDGVALVVGNRVLVKNQTDAKTNGIYLVDAGTWTRVTDVDSSSEITTATVVATAGTLNKNTQWTCITPDIVLGTTDISFGQIAGAGTYANGTGLLLSGNTFLIDGTVATLAGAQTLTNKTITSPLGITTTDVSDVTNKRYVTDSNLTVLNNTSNINTGDETLSTIKSKLGISTLSGSNTGDQDLSSYATNSNLNLKAPLDSPTFTGTVTSPSFVKSGGTSAQFLKADGSVDSNSYLSGSPSKLIFAPVDYDMIDFGAYSSHSFLMKRVNLGGGLYSVDFENSRGGGGGTYAKFRFKVNNNDGPGTTFSALDIVGTSVANTAQITATGNLSVTGNLSIGGAFSQNKVSLSPSDYDIINGGVYNGHTFNLKRVSLGNGMYSTDFESFRGGGGGTYGLFRFNVNNNTASTTFAALKIIGTGTDNIGQIDVTGDLIVSRNLTINGGISLPKISLTPIDYNILDGGVYNGHTFNLKRVNSGGICSLDFINLRPGVGTTNAYRFILNNPNNASTSFTALEIKEGTVDDLANVTLKGNFTSASYKLSALNTAPSSATDTGTVGEIRITSTYVYVCISTNVWVRTALATW